MFYYLGMIALENGVTFGRVVCCAFTIPIYFNLRRLSWIDDTITAVSLSIRDSFDKT